MDHRTDEAHVGARQGAGERVMQTARRIGPQYRAAPVREAGRWWMNQLAHRMLFAVPALPDLVTTLDQTFAFLRVWSYLHRAQVPGDYLEFGVFRGQSFIVALETAGKVMKRARGTRRFFAFDSFTGLPHPDAEKDAGVFRAGDDASGEQVFRRHIARAARGWQVIVVPGFYDKSLTDSLRRAHDMRQAAFVTVDCDLYPSTVDVLRFITPLVGTGTVLYFDDWNFAGGDLTRGEPRACHEWLAKNPDITLIDFGRVGGMGQLFLVNRAARQVSP